MTTSCDPAAETKRRPEVLRPLPLERLVIPVDETLAELDQPAAPRDYIYSPLFLQWQEEPPALDWEALDELQQGTRLKAARERYWFRLMNFLKYRADVARRRAVGRSDEDAEHRSAMYLAQSQQIRNALLLLFMRLVNSVVIRYRREDLPLDELLSEGAWVLLGAVEKFDADRGFRFSTYATHALHRHLRRRGLVAQRHVPQSQLPHAVAEPLDHRAGEHEGSRYGRAIDLIRAAVELLPAREATIVQMRFGFSADGQRHTLTHIADQLGLSRERVRQLEQRAIAHLRARTFHQLDELYA